MVDLHAHNGRDTTRAHKLKKNLDNVFAQDPSLSVEVSIWGFDLDPQVTMTICI